MTERWVSLGPASQKDKMNDGKWRWRDRAMKRGEQEREGGEMEEAEGEVEFRWND